MQNFAIIGLGRFGQCMLESLARRRMQILVVDRQEEKVQFARDLATEAVKADALNFDLFKELLPEDLDCAIVDLGDQMERSILVTNYLHKLEVPHVIVEAVNPQHAEILEIVGATRIVFPEREAAERLAGLLAGQDALEFFPVSEEFSLIEVPAPRKWVGKSLMELDLRKGTRVNVVAFCKQTPTGDQGPWRLSDPQRRFEGDDLVLLAGNTKDLNKVRD